MLTMLLLARRIFQDTLHALRRLTAASTWSESGYQRPNDLHEGKVLEERDYDEKKI